MFIEKLRMNKHTVNYLLVDNGKEVARFTSLLQAAIAKRFFDGCIMTEEELNIIRKIL